MASDTASSGKENMELGESSSAPACSSLPPCSRQKSCIHAPALTQIHNRRCAAAGKKKGPLRPLFLQPLTIRGISSRVSPISSRLRSEREFSSSSTARRSRQRRRPSSRVDRRSAATRGVCRAKTRDSTLLKAVWFLIVEDIIHLIKFTGGRFTATQQHPGRRTLCPAPRALIYSRTGIIARPAARGRPAWDACKGVRYDLRT